MRSVAPKCSPGLRSNQTPTLTPLSAGKLTAPTTRPAPARWARRPTRWQSLTRTRGSLASSGCAWSTPPSCPASSAATWTLRPSWWQRRPLTSSEVALLSLTQVFLCTDPRRSTRRDEMDHTSRWVGHRSEHNQVLSKQEHWTVYYVCDWDIIVLSFIWLQHDEEHLWWADLHDSSQRQKCCRSLHLESFYFTF